MCIPVKNSFTDPVNHPHSLSHTHTHTHARTQTHAHNALTSEKWSVSLQTSTAGGMLATLALTYCGFIHYCANEYVLSPNKAR